MTKAALPAANPVTAFRPGPRVIEKAVVIGAGSMGSGIAAQLANAGVSVVLLDLPSPGDDPAAIARAGVANQLKAGGFMRADVADLMAVGTTDELHLAADADWIVEAVLERLDVKQDLFRRIEAVRKDGSIVSSNTSTLLRAAIGQGMPERFLRDFVITHFFNPPRHMQLVELVGGDEVPPATLERAARICELELGKTAVMARDTPGFIANRLGCYWTAMAALEAIDLGLDVEAADAVLTGATGAPATGVFGLLDLIGIDLVPHVWGSLYSTLPADDAFHAVDLQRSPVFQDMLANRRFGRKTKAGFYRLAADRSREAWDYVAGAYRPERRPAKFGPEILESDGLEGRFARRVIVRTVAYAAATAAEIAGDRESIDLAMRLGYAWTRGPIEMVDHFGADRILNWAAAEGLSVPPLAPTHGEAAASSQSPARPAIVTAADASVLDLGDGVACLELQTKMNVFTDEVFETLHRAIERVNGDFQALVVTGKGTRAYSAGADLTHISRFVEAGDFTAVEAFLRDGQTAFQALKQAPFPVVAAAFGLALGGGCESLLHCDAIVAHAELKAGLPEAKVGIVPGWGGCTLMFARALASGLSAAAAAERAFDDILVGRISTSALDAAGFGVLRPGDRIVMNRSALLGEAKALALELAQGYRAPAPEVLPAGGPALRDRLLARMEGRTDLSPHDRVIGQRLAEVLSGGAGAGVISEAGMLDLEREAVLELARTPETTARIGHMLATGKPLRN